MDHNSQFSDSRHIRLRDGRQLAYARYGKVGGQPIFYFTGGNSSRLEGMWFEQAAQQHAIDLIVPDRPGFGLSDFKPDRQFLDWPADVEQLADSLNIDRFAILGLSGGSPHVAAVCRQLPERVTKAAIASGVAPPEMPDKFTGMWPPVRMIFTSARYAPWLNRILLGQMSKFYADEEQMRSRMKQALPAPDVALIDARPEIMSIFSAAAREAHRQGVQGDAWEWQLYVHPWGFGLDEIPGEIGLWYGTVDKNVPVGMGHYLAQHLPHGRLTVVPDGGHFSTINNHISTIFNYLTGER